MTEYVNKDYYNSIKGNCTYIDLNANTIHKVMERLRADGIMFSATYGGYRNTITVSKNDAQRANAIAAEYKTQANAQNRQNYQQRIIGNIKYSQIRDRNFINTDPATALQVANLLSGDTSIRFSGRILANSATITVSGRKNAEMVNRMIENIRNSDIINELYRAGYERMADTNGFVNIRNNSTGEIVGFRSMDMVREMFHDQSNEFFHPSAYRVDMTAETAQPYYISEVEKSSAEERNVYVDENGGVPTFESQPEAEEYASNNGIDLSDFEEIISEEAIPENVTAENVPVENVPPEHREFSDAPLSVQLSERIAAEYNFFISNLKNEKPEVIIAAAYEINTKDNIRTYVENEELDLSDAQMKALLSSENLLNEVYQEWNKNESANSYDDVSMILADRADRILLSLERREKENVPVEHIETEQEEPPAPDVPVEHSEPKQEEIVFSNVPIYTKSPAEAREQGEIEIYRESRKANSACADMIDAVLSKHYNNNRIDSESALNDLLEKFSADRIALVTALNIRSKDWDGRISRENKEWANVYLSNVAPEIRERPDGCYLTTHPGLLNLFANTVRSHLEKEKELAAQEKDEIYDTLDLDNNAITFSVVTIDSDVRFVVPEHLDRYDIHALEQYQDYIAVHQEEEINVSVEYLMLGDMDIETESALSDEADFIEKHLDEVLDYKYTTSLEYEEYTIKTPDEMLESKQEEMQLEQAKEYIRSYLESEFLSGNVSFDDLEHISAGYSVLGEYGEYGLQMEIDLVNLKIRYTIDNENIKTESYDSLAEMNELALSELNFDDFYSIGTDALAEFEAKRFRLAIPDLAIDADMREIDCIEVQTPDDKLVFYYSKNNNDIERAWESDDNSDTAVRIEEVRNDLLNAKAAGFIINVRETGYVPVNLFNSLDYDENKAFSDFISSMDFTVVKVGEKYALRDETNYGDIHSDTFDDASAMTDRLDIYINDFYITDIAEQMEAAGLGDIVLLDEMTSLERIYKAIKAASSDERMKEFFNNHLSDMKVIDLCINKIESVDLDIAFENAEIETPVVPTGMSVIEDIDNAVLMWERGIEIFCNNEPVPAHRAGDKASEVFEDESGVYTASKSDAETFSVADTIASAIWDMNETFNAVPNEVGMPYYLSLEKSYDEWADYKKGLNEYENTLNALYDGNYSSVITYIENIRDSEDVSDELREQAESLLDEVEHFKELSGIPERDSKAVDYLAGRLTEPHHGKFKIEEYYESYHPTVNDLANYIKDLVENERQGFGLGGYAASPNGITLPDLSEYSWEQVAQAVIKAVENDRYISADERAEKANAPKYTIYQIKKGEEYHNSRFTDWKDLKRFNIPFDKNSYESVYGGYLTDISRSQNRAVILDDIFRKFNVDRPEDFRGHSLSVSDIIVLEDKNGSSAFFVDSYGMTEVTDLFFDLEKQKIDISKLSAITLTEEYNRRMDQPDDFLHIKNTISFSNLNSSYLISRYKEFTYEDDVLPDADEGDTFATRQGMLAEVQEFFEDSRSDSTKSISITDLNGKTTTLEGRLFEFEATEDRLAFMIPNVGYAEMFERDDDSYDYTIYDSDFNVTDSGVYDDVSISLRQAFTIILEEAGYDIDRCEPMDFEKVHGRAEEKEEQSAPASDTGRKKSGNEVEVGDVFLYNGREYTVESEKGIYPDDVGISYLEQTGGVTYLATQNIDRYKLAENGIFLGNPNKVQEEEAPSAESKKTEYVPKIGDLIDINDELLSISDISGSIITFTETENLLGNTSRMSISDFLASEFTVVEEAEREAAPDVPVEHFESEAEVETVNVPVEHHTSNARNFVITDENFGVKTPKARFAANVEAIRTLNNIESENRTATPVEQAVLSGYTGWGAIPQAFDSDNKDWSNEYAQLKELLTDDEYMAARRSTMNAHFTSPVIINAIYEGLKNIGFESGKILEPAMGIGNFFGAMPENMRKSELHGVELDSLTGRIAKQLYPDADIQIKGFEKTKFENDSFDAVVGNVPFGDYKVDDKDYNKHKFYIHDYFVAKAIDKVRPGGVLAVVTSKGTMDKENSEMRTYIAQRAELLGAIRLPNDAFKKNAGTEVTSDILFFQKRERPIEIKPDEVEWLSKGTTEDGFSVNNYFVNHPEMVLGTIAEANQMYGPTENTQVLPIEGADLKTQLSEAVKNIHGTYTPQTRKAEKKKEAEDIIPAPANSRTYSYYAVDNSIYYRGDDETMSKVKLSGDGLKRALAMVEIRDTVRELLDMQLDNADHTLDGDIADKREKLNQTYDAFTAKYGHFDEKKNARLFKGDDGYSFLTALEARDKDSGEYKKADIFYHDTVKPNSVVEHVETAQEALILSIAEKAKVDFDYMSELCGMDKNTLINELEGQIFRLPQEKEKYVTADEYLTGNIRQKLRELNNAPIGMDVSRHKEALEAAMPKRVEAKDISVKLGSHWVSPEFVTQFINEKFRPGWKSNIEAQYSKASGKWKIEGAGKNDKTSYAAMHDYGTKRKDAYSILEGILNHEDLTVKDPKLDEYGNPVRDSRDNIVKVTNHEETKAVQSMARKIESAWQDWIFKDPDRRTVLVDKYNEVFNSIRHREYDGSHLNFVGMNSDITLKEHQKNAVARALYGGNTMLAHCVGAGKTYEMITIAMEGKRLGLHHKSLFAVPNSLTEQMGRDFKKLYPAANILVAAKKDFEPKNRRELFAKIATGEWDAVIVGHSQFDRMGLSKDRMEKYMQAEIGDLREQLEEAKDKDGSKSFSVKEIEKTIARYEKKVKDSSEKVAKDDYIDFEEMGFDKIFVDECHLYKNLGTATKMSNVAGIGTTGSGKAAELLMKTKYLDEITGGKGLVFASGTPVSNSMTELYTMMRYLQTALLKECDINHFDEWAADFGEVKTDYELKPESDGKYQLKTRFAKFTNLPELMGMFKEAADVRTADTLDLEKPVSHVHEVVAQPSKIQRRLIKSLAKRAAKIRDGNVDPKEDNMLCVTNDGRKIGLDQRLMQPGCPDNSNSKVNMCVNNVFDIYTKTAPNRSTQVIFCDMSTPKSDARQDRFEIYRPDKSKDSGFDLIRKKVGLGSGDEDSSKRISSFADIKSYVDKHSPDAEDKLQEGDIAVFRIPSEIGTSIESRAAVYTNGQLIEYNSYNLLDSLGMSPIEAMPEKPFNVYDDIRNKLIGLGVPEKEIAFIHDYDTAEKKQALFNQMNNGEVRVLLGSTAKCGAGMNSQQKMIALHHLDAPLRPSDMEQRNGRIERQGNENPEVDIFRYVTDKSFDAYLYQILENKQKFISQVMTSKTPERVCSDIDEAALDYAEVKALCAGNPLIKKEMELQAQIKDLKSEKARYNENLYELQDNIRVKYPNEIMHSELVIKHYTADLQTANSAPKAIDEEGKVSYPLKMGDKVYPTRKEAGEAFKEAVCKNLGMMMSGKEIQLGEYRGLQLSVMYNDFRKMPQACLKGEKAHYCDINIETTAGNIIRLDNVINNIQKSIDDLSAKVEIKKNELEQMEIDVEKPFEKEQELAAAEAELEDVHIKLTQFELTDDSAQKDMFERLVDTFPEVLTGEKPYVKYEAECFMPLHVEMNSDVLTISQTYVQNGDLMYDPRIDFKVDYENKKVIPQSFENSGEGVYERYDISDGKPETMKQINDILTFTDDWMDRIDEQGYSAPTEIDEVEHKRDTVLR